MMPSMKILCISDEVDPLIYSVNVKKRFADIDLVISAGDLPGRYYEFIMSSLNKPLLFVNGNHHGLHAKGGEEYAFDQKTDAYFGECLEGRSIYLRKLDLLVAGLGGSMRYNYGPDQYTEAEMRWRIKRLAPTLMMNKVRHGRYLDLLVTHAPPQGMGDGPDLCHRGFECFNSFIDRYRPTYLLHGHVHMLDQNKRPLTEVGDTKVVNVYRSYIIEMGGKADAK